jgi:hypothetical protein
MQGGVDAASPGTSTAHDQQSLPLPSLRPVQHHQGSVHCDSSPKITPIRRLNDDGIGSIRPSGPALWARILTTPKGRGSDVRWRCSNFDISSPRRSLTCPVSRRQPRPGNLRQQIITAQIVFCNHPSFVTDPEVPRAALGTPVILRECRHSRHADALRSLHLAGLLARINLTDASVCPLSLDNPRSFRCNQRRDWLGLQQLCLFEASCPRCRLPPLALSRHAIETCLQMPIFCRGHSYHGDITAAVSSQLLPRSHLAWAATLETEAGRTAHLLTART